MSNEKLNVYEDTETEALMAGDATIRYIYDGEVDGLPLEFRGLKFYGAIKALRENDTALHGDASELTEAQQTRLQEIEDDLDSAAAKDLQYYPFGHKRNKDLDKFDYNARQRAGLVTSWGVKERKPQLKRSRHASEIILPVRPDNT